MDKKIAGLLGAVSAFAAMDAAQAAVAVAPDPASALKASSYAELLDPVPNAMEALTADDEARDAVGANVRLAQFYRRDHHHHHHNRYFRRVIPRFVVPFGHHHHHHHRYYRRHDRY